MPLPLLNLDDRRWTDLVEEGTAQIPRYAEQWTDHNVHDPGRTLVELFAWLTESSIYRLNRIPERHRRKFLALLGCTSQPPQAAHTFLTFSPETGTGPFALPAGTSFETSAATAPVVRFRTLRDLTISIVHMSALQVDEGDGQLQDQTRHWREQLPLYIFGSNPRAGASLYLGFKELTAAQPVALAFSFQGPGNDAQERGRLIGEAAAERCACRHPLPDIHCRGVHEPAQAETKLPPHHSAVVVWEVFTGAGPQDWTQLAAIEATARPSAGQVADDTRALTLDGIVELNLPATMAQTKLGAVPDALFYLRVRLVRGSYDAPPVLVDLAPNAVRAEQAVPVSQSFKIPVGVVPNGTAPTPSTSTRLRMKLKDDGSIKALTFIPPGHAAPEVPVLSYTPPVGLTPGAITLRLVLVGIGTGEPEQQLNLPHAPMQVESLRLYTHLENSWREWHRRDDLDASTRTTYDFMLDAETGQINFGDGERGRVPPARSLILAAYCTTAAASGNVAANTINRLAHTLDNDVALAALPASVQAQLSRITTNRAPACGGAALEELPQTIGRAVETLRAHERLLELASNAKSDTLDQVAAEQVRMLVAPQRGVNLIDLERLALDVPGTRVARARAWANVHPAFPCLQAPGCITVVLVPDALVPAPQPSRGLLDTVKRYLERRRLLCTRLEVVGPRYLTVRVVARVRKLTGALNARIEARVVEALNNFFDPRRGGPDGLGWPFGRDVFRSEVLQLIDGVDGVDHVLMLRLLGDDNEGRCGDLSVCPTWLVTPGAHQIEIV
jgi:Baseplate J-like protein